MRRIGMYYNSKNPLTREQIQDLAPSIFAEKPASWVGEDYGFISSVDILKFFEEKGWKVWSATEQRAKIKQDKEIKDPDDLNTKLHVVKMRHQSLDLFKPTKVGDLWPELVFKNSHDGSFSCQIMLGIYRFVCANGLLSRGAKEADVIRIKHQGFRQLDTRFFSDKMSVASEKTMKSIGMMKDIEMSEDDKLQFANWAIDTRSNSRISVEPEQVLVPQRTEDHGRDLFTTLNVAQEWLIRGGVQGRNQQGKSYKTRPINSITEDIRINQDLWRITEQAASILA